MATTIALNGIGFSGTVEVEEGESYADALAKAGFDTPENLDISVDGVDIEDAAATPVEAGEGETPEVVATPKAAELG